MFSDMIRDLPCEACELGKIIYDGRETMVAWQDDNVFRLDDVDKLVDGIIDEPLGGAHVNPEEMYKSVKKLIKEEIAELKKMNPEERIEKRMQKYINIGIYNG